MVWSQVETNSELIPWKIRVAQKLMVGHIRHTVTQARTTVTKMGLSTPGVTCENAIFCAKGSMKKKLMTKQMGTINRISNRAGQKQALVIPPNRKEVLYSSIANTMKTVIKSPNTTS